jgi:hypothetical protein
MIDQVIKNLFAAAKEDQNFMNLMSDPSAQTLGRVKEPLKAKYLAHTGTFMDKHYAMQEVFVTTLRDFAHDFKKNGGDWHHLVSLSGTNFKTGTFEQSGLIKLGELKTRFTNDLREAENQIILTRIDEQEEQGELTQSEAEEKRILAEQGRLLLYSDGGEFDQIISMDEVEALQAETSDEEATIQIFNPLWNNGEPEVKVTELKETLKRKETIEIETTMEMSGMGIEEITVNSEEGVVEGSFKTAQGTFRFRVKLDDGSHKPVEYEIISEAGEVTTLPAEELTMMTGIDGFDAMALKDRVEKTSQDHQGGHSTSTSSVGSSMQMAIPKGMTPPPSLSSDLKGLVTGPKPETGAVHRSLGGSQNDVGTPLPGSGSGVPAGPASGSSGSSSGGSGGGTGGQTEGSGMPGTGEATKAKPAPVIPKSSGKKSKKKAAEQQQQEVQQQQQAQQQEAVQAAAAQAAEQFEEKEQERAHERFTGAASAKKKKKVGRVVVAAGLTGGTAIAIPTATGLFAIFRSGPSEDATAFVSTLIHSLFA